MPFPGSGKMVYRFYSVQALVKAVYGVPPGSMLSMKRFAVTEPPPAVSPPPSFSFLFKWSLGPAPFGAEGPGVVGPWTLVFG